MRVLVWLGSPASAAAVFWSCFGACVDPRPLRGPPVARVIASWDPLACGDPHRVVVELTGDAGAPLSASAPCSIGAITLDRIQLGSYRGRTYAWTLGEPIRSVAPVELEVEDDVVRWAFTTPR
jgi:hypothetical protein